MTMDANADRAADRLGSTFARTRASPQMPAGEGRTGGVTGYP